MAYDEHSVERKNRVRWVDGGVKGWQRIFIGKRWEHEIVSTLDRLAEPLSAVEELLWEAVESRVESVSRMARHLLSAGGKRLRPALTLLSAWMAGSITQKAILYAAVVELMHTATLIHDDVIDKAVTRRGKATVHTIWGNESAVMCGDHLYASAFSRLAEDGDIRVIRAMADASRRVCEGEILELELAYRLDLSESDCLRVAQLKTGALIGAACQVGVIAGVADGRNPQRLADALRHYGCLLGVAFQLVDDVLDMESTEETLGKPVGSDLLEGKITLPAVWTIAQLGPEERERWWRLAAQRHFPEQDAASLARRAQETGQLDRVRAFAGRIARQAVSYLDSYDGVDSDRRWARDALRDIADYIVKRRA